MQYHDTLILDLQKYKMDTCSLKSKEGKSVDIWGEFSRICSLLNNQESELTELFLKPKKAWLLFPVTNGTVSWKLVYLYQEQIRDLWTLHRTHANKNV